MRRIKAISIKEQSEIRKIKNKDSLAYLSGVIEGDGWCNNKSMGLLCKDKDFADEFSRCLNNVFNLNKKPRRDKRGYFEVKGGNESGRFDVIRKFSPKTDKEKGMWLRGFFDSEGSAIISKIKGLKSSYAREISTCNSDIETLRYTKKLLEDLEIISYLRKMSENKKRWGDKAIYKVILKQDKNNFIMFRDYVNFSIKRKRDKIYKIVNSYSSDGDLKKILRKAQISSSKKRKNERKKKLKIVLDGIRKLIKNGIKPTQINCRQIRFYNTIHRWYKQEDLVNMAKKITMKGLNI